MFSSFYWVNFFLDGRYVSFGPIGYCENGWTNGHEIESYTNEQVDMQMEHVKMQVFPRIAFQTLNLLLPLL